MKKLFLVSLMLLLTGVPAFSAASSTEKDKEQTEKKGFGFAALPAISYTSDDGFGFGARLYMDNKDGIRKPYGYAINAGVFFTTEGKQSHLLKFDWVKPFHTPLRFTPTVGFFKSGWENYCGIGPNVTCSEQAANEAARSSSVEEHDLQAWDNQYYKYRYYEIYGRLESRWQWTPEPHKLEGLFVWRGSHYKMGDFSEDGPYKGSLFETDFRNFDQGGFANILEMGLLYDTRDQETSPLKGAFFQATVRGGHKALLSSWNYIGGHLGVSAYWSPLSNDTLTFASNTILDAIWGPDIPLNEMIRVGGLSPATAFGGAYVGRGIRTQKYVGRIKAIERFELRSNWIKFGLWKQKFILGGALFADGAFILADHAKWEHLKNPLVGFGGGLRMAWNKTFVVRIDIGASPQEGYKPQFYAKVGQAF